MKKVLIIISIVLWIISIPIIFLCVNKYIESKDQRLKSEFYDSIADIFNDRYYIDLVYSGKKVSYDKINIPNKPKPFNFSDQVSEHSLEKWDKILLEEWQDYYGDLYKLYNIKNNGNEWIDSYGAENGWCLVLLSADGDGLFKQWISPYGLGYKKQEYYFGYDFAPSVREAVNEALDFFMNNEKSHMRNYIDIGSHDRIMSEVNESTNEYYTILRDTTPRFWISGKTELLGDEFKYSDGPSWTHSISPTPYSYMQNGFFRCFVGITQPVTWSLKRMDYIVERNREFLLKCWLIPTSCFFLLLILVLSISLYKTNKKSKETELEKLIRLVNPKNFMNPYDKEKVEKANTLYKTILTLDSKDQEGILSLINEASKQLGITFIDGHKLCELKKKVSPKNFMEPYDADKISLANDLYAILNKPHLSYSEYIFVNNEAKKLH